MSNQNTLFNQQGTNPADSFQMIQKTNKVMASNVNKTETETLQLESHQLKHWKQHNFTQLYGRKSIIISIPMA